MPILTSIYAPVRLEVSVFSEDLRAQVPSLRSDNAGDLCNIEESLKVCVDNFMRQKSEGGARSVAQDGAKAERIQRELQQQISNMT